MGSFRLKKKYRVIIPSSAPRVHLSENNAVASMKMTAEFRAPGDDTQRGKEHSSTFRSYFEFAGVSPYTSPATCKQSKFKSEVTDTH